MASPTGRDVKRSIPMSDTPTILSATQIPVPKKISKIEMKKIVKNSSGMISYYFSLRLKE